MPPAPARRATDPIERARSIDAKVEERMRTSTKVWVIVALLASVSPLAAQRPRAERHGAGRDGMDRMGPMGRMGPRGMGEARSVERVIGIALERRDSLGLSAEQMDGLEALRADVEQRNAELPPADGAGTRGDRQRARRGA